jgi:hypothetical protein
MKKQILKSNHIKKCRTDTKYKARRKGHKNGKEKEDENVDGNVFANKNDELIQTAQRRHNLLFTVALIGNISLKGCHSNTVFACTYFSTRCEREITGARLLLELVTERDQSEFTDHPDKSFNFHVYMFDIKSEDNAGYAETCGVLQKTCCWCAHLWKYSYALGTEPTSVTQQVSSRGNVLACSKEALGSNLGRSTNSTDGGFRFLFIASRQISKYYLKLGHDCLLSHTSQFIIS